MEKLTTLNLTFDRVLIQLIIPGFIGSFPFILLFFENRPGIEVLDYLENKSLVLIFTIFVSLVMGIFLENLGSRFEVWVYDKRQEKKHKDYMKIWKKFLAMKYEGGEPIGHRYIRNILFRMKFELSTGIGLIFMVAGLGFYNLDHTLMVSICMNFFIVYFLPIAISLGLLFWEGWLSSQVLEETRRLLVDKYSS